MVSNSISLAYYIATFVYERRQLKKEQYMMPIKPKDEPKYVHPVSLEIPMDFWYAVEKQIVDKKIKKGLKVMKKDHILELLELGYAQMEKVLNKGNPGPKDE